MDNDPTIIKPDNLPPEPVTTPPDTSVPLSPIPDSRQPDSVPTAPEPIPSAETPPVTQVISPTLPVESIPAVPPQAITPSPPTDPVQAAANKPKKNMLIIAIIVLVLIIGGIAAYFALHSPSKSSTKSNTSSSTTSTPSNSVTQNAQNTSRRQDASVIQAAINEYISNNNGSLPQTAAVGSASHELLLCSGTCTSSNSSTVNLSFYTASNVSFHAYDATLKVPDDKTVYIVNKAICASSNAIGAQTTSLSAAVLYAAQNGSSFVQYCLAG